ncbi:hypothetical protein BDN70DRAFT_599484, partial [Pholiota conissans]
PCVRFLPHTRFTSLILAFAFKTGALLREGCRGRPCIHISALIAPPLLHVASPLARSLSPRPNSWPPQSAMKGGWRENMGERCI